MGGGGRYAKWWQRRTWLVIGWLIILTVAFILLGTPQQQTRSALERQVAHPVIAKSDVVISDRAEQMISLTIKSLVPQVDDLYVHRLSDGGIALYATASLQGFKLSQSLANDISDRFLYGAYRELPNVRVDFAGLYVRFHGHYVMAAGLGRAIEKQLSVQVFAPDQGIALSHELQSLNQYEGALPDQAYAEYRAP